MATGFKPNHCKAWIIVERASGLRMHEDQQNPLRGAIECYWAPLRGAIGIAIVPGERYRNECFLFNYIDVFLAKWLEYTLVCNYSPVWAIILVVPLIAYLLDMYVLVNKDLLGIVQR